MYKISIKKESSLQVSIMAAGFSALMVQVILLRNFLTIFNGNELIIGIILSNWMLLTGAGALIGKWLFNEKNPGRYIIIYQLLSGFTPAVSLFALLFAKAYLFPPGLIPGLVESWIYSAIILLPCCITSGALFTVFAKVYSHLLMKPKAPEVYALEAAGSATGSILFTFFLLRFFTPPEILVVVASIHCASAILISISFHKKPASGHLIMISLLVWVMFHLFFDWYNFAVSLNYKGQKLVESRDNAFGNITVTESGGAYFIYENGIPADHTTDVASLEESVHYAMLQHKDPKNVMVISGNLNGIFKEIEKYHPARTDFVEINPLKPELTETYSGNPKSPDLFVHTSDPVNYIRNTRHKYDVVLLNTPPPATLSGNRFYTLQFFEKLKSAMTDDGVVSIKLEGGKNYLGPEKLELYSIIVKTLSRVFKNQVIIPGNSNYLLASDAGLHYNIAQRSEALDTDNAFVNPYYINDQLLEIRGRGMLSLLDKDAKINEDFEPAAYFADIKYWLSWDNIHFGWVLILLATFFIITLLAFNLPSKAMFVTGFTASSVEIIILLMFQVLFGNLYQSIALLIAAFMAGLGAGSYYAEKRHFGSKFRALPLNQLLAGLTALLLALAVFASGSDFMSSWMIKFLLYIMMIFAGMITGMQFTAINIVKLPEVGKRAASAYAADLIGSAGGALITAIFLIPAFGIIKTATGIFALNLGMAVALFLSGKRRQGF